MFKLDLQDSYFMVPIAEKLADLHSDPVRRGQRRFGVVDLQPREDEWRHFGMNSGVCIGIFNFRYILLYSTHRSTVMDS